MDLRNLSDAELQAIIAQERKPVPPAAPPAEAPPAELRARTAGSGLDLSKMSDEELARFVAQPVVPDVQADVAKSFIGSGVPKAISYAAGLPGDVKELVGQGVKAAGTALGLPEPPPAPPPASALERFRAAIEPPTSEQVRSKIESVAGPLYTPKTGAGRAAEAVGEFALAPLVAPEGLAASALARYAIAPGLASWGAGEATKGTQYEAPAKMVAALAAPAVAGRAITPFNVGAGRREMAAALKGEGVPATAGDVTGNQSLKYLESQLRPGGWGEKEQKFTQAALRRIGVDAPLATTGKDGVIDQAFKRIGANFDGLATRNVAVADQRTATDLGNIFREYNAIPGIHSPETVSAVNGSIQHIVDAFKARGGQMTGADYQTLRSRLRSAAQGSSDPNKSAALHDVTEALDDTMARSIAAHNPADAGLWGQARREYRNMLVIEKAIGAAGEGTAHGIISPAQLASAAKSVYGKRAYLRGQDDFSELADAGRALMGSPPDSGTSRRVTMENLMASLGGGVGALFGSKHGMAGEGSVAGMLGGHYTAPFVELAARPPARAVVMNPWVQKWLANQASPHVPLNQNLSQQAIMARALAQLPQQQQAQPALPPP